MADPSEAETLYENVEQFLNDENKIVTFEFLSQSCGIHVNLAKTVLEKYAEDWKKKTPADPLQVVFSLSGYIGKNLKFLLVSDANLEAAKSKLDRILHKHIYSIQKGKLPSFSLLYNSNHTELKKSIQQCSWHSSICNTSVKLRTNEERKYKAPVEVKKPVTKPSEPVNVEDEVKTKIEVTKEAKPAEKKAAAKPGIAAMFAKQQTKPPAEKKVVEKPEEIKKPTTNKRVVREPSDDEDENKDVNIEKTNTTKRFKLSEEEKPVKVTKKANKKPAKKGREVIKTQRKRIQQISDSESSDAEEDEDIVLASPESPPPVPMLEDDDVDFLEATVVEPTAKRSRKLVTKHFMDENGYMVTTKKFETCEVDEEAMPEEKAVEKVVVTAKTETKTPAKQPSPPGKPKQKSITSFFTRK